MSVRLEDLGACFQGIVPSLIATCSADGEPNVTYLSQVTRVDSEHVALSCQFFNKTRRNVAENPLMTIVFNDPVNLRAFRLVGRFVRAETSGPLFEQMSVRIDVIASHTGMTGVFRLLSADVYRVLSVEEIEGFLLPADPLLDGAEAPVGGPLTELRGLQVVCERIGRAGDLEDLMEVALTALDELLGFSHSMILLLEPGGERLVTAASRGYGGKGLGATVELGAGLVGAAAASRRMVRVAGFGNELRYGRAIRHRVEECGGRSDMTPELPLPGLADAEAQLALPLLLRDELVGVLAVESHDPLCFDEWDEAFLQIVANQIAAAIEARRSAAPAPELDGRPLRRFVFYRNDDCIFVDGEYLVRNVPGRILWKLLAAHRTEGRHEFTNRELRLDPSLGLPPLKDNLEARLILLRQRLAARCPQVRLVPVRRGRFALELDCRLELEERDQA